MNNGKLPPGRAAFLFLQALFCTCALLCGCKDPYISPYKSPQTGYLVVEGYISGNSVTQFMLSRTISLPGDSTLPTENGATVSIEGSDNSTYPLTGTGNGIYSSVDTLSLNPQTEYRLSIGTSNGEKYQSDFAPYKITPPIDSVNWVLNPDNSVQIYVNAHDPANNTRYYQWNYDQIYQYSSAEESLVYWDKDTTPHQIVARPANDEVYYCWLSGSSTTIIIDNTTKLASDVVYRQPVYYIPPNNVQLSILYSILVRQYALTADGYNFLLLMQQNTESLGSIFDRQPTQITGNIHCLTNPSEEVIGYVSAGTVQWQRIFIARSQVQSTYFPACPAPDTTFANNYQILEENYSNGYTPMYNTPAGWVSNYTICLDCTTQGGTNKRPVFWPSYAP